MTDADRDSLGAHAEAHAEVGCLRSKQVLALLAENESLTAALASSVAIHDELTRALSDQRQLNYALAERICAQSELLSKRAAAPVTHPCH